MSREQDKGIQALRLFYHPQDRLRLTIEGDRSYITVRPVWAAPLSHPGRYLALLDGKGEEIALLENPEELTEESWRAVQTELRRRYLTAYVERVCSVRVEYGATYWHVQTDRGEREFVTQSLQENVFWFSPTHLQLVDVDGNRFEIRDIRHLDLRSRLLMQKVL